ncbi:hypothetical protein ACO0QE_000018 [Hanseniaspora vineae]
MKLQLILIYLTLCFVSRYTIFQIFPSLSETLDNTVEFSTPISSFKTLKEGWYLINKGLPLYYKKNGGIINQPPLLIYLLKPLQDRIDVVFCLMDCLMMFMFVKLVGVFNKTRGNFLKATGQSSVSHTENSAMEQKIAIWYLLNPLVFLNCISKSTTVFNHVFVLMSVLAGLKKSFVLSGVCIAIGGYINVHSLYLIFPLLNFTTFLKNGGESEKLQAEKPRSSQTPEKSQVKKSQLVTLLCSFSATVALLLYASYTISSNQWWFLYNVYFVNLSFDKIFPNIGIWWYFFIEIFKFFRPFFQMVFNLFSASFIIPFTLRFHQSQQTLYCFVICLGWLILTKPYPTFGELGFFVQFVCFFDPIKCYFTYSIVSVLIFLHTLVLAPIFYYLWISLGSGNSNFFYAITLVYSVGLASVLVDMVWSMLRLEFDGGRPQPERKVVQQ